MMHVMEEAAAVWCLVLLNDYAEGIVWYKFRSFWVILTFW